MGVISTYPFFLCIDARANGLKINGLLLEMLKRLHKYEKKNRESIKSVVTEKYKIGNCATLHLNSWLRGRKPEHKPGSRG